MTATLARLFRRQARPDVGELSFTIELTEDELDGGFVAEVLELPGCMSQGDTFDEAMSNIVDAIAEVLATRLAPQIEAPRRNDGSPVRHVSTHLVTAG